MKKQVVMALILILFAAAHVALARTNWGVVKTFYIERNDHHYEHYLLLHLILCNT